MTYDKEFEEWYNKEARYNGDIQACMHDAWQAARKDHYRIGEEVEIRFSPDDEYETANICASSRDKTGGYLSYTPSNVRRIPPKSRIDEIAEEAASKWFNNPKAVSSDSLSDAIKSAILKDREEREADLTEARDALKEIQG
jgi:hypothetical protein